MVSPAVAAVRAWLASSSYRRAGLLLALSVVVFASMPARELTFDSAFIIGDDTRLRDFSAESLRLIFVHDYWWPSIASSLYRPLTTLGFWFEYSFLGFGDRPFGYQLINLVLNFGNALLVMSLAVRFGLGSITSLLVAGVFSLHPITTEVVANIVGRSDLLACSAVLGGLLCYLRGVDCSGEGWLRWRWFSASGLCAFLGILAKENSVVLPALVAWHGLCRLGELGNKEMRRGWLRDAACVILIFSPSVILLLFLRQVFTDAIPGVADHPFMDNPLVAEGPLPSILTALGVWGMQLKTLFWPLTLSSDYSFDAIPVASWSPPNEVFWWGVGTLAGIGGAAVALFTAGRRCTGARFLFGAYSIAMLPTSNVLIEIGSIRADRFHYAPSAFFWCGVAVSAAFISRRLAESEPRVLELLKPRFHGVVAIWCVCLAVLSHLRCYDWRSNITLWESALAAAPGSVKAQAAVANERVRLRNDETSAREALISIETALSAYVSRRVDPADWPILLFSDYGAFSTNLYGELAANPERQQEAKQHLDSALLWLSKGLEYELAMRTRWAERWAGGDVEKAPISEVLHRNYAVALHRAGRDQEAIDALGRLLNERPFLHKVRELRAEIVLSAGKPNDAIEEYMLLSVMKQDSAGFVGVLGEAIKEWSPQSKPLIRDVSGNWRLDLDDAAVSEALAKACRRHLEILRGSEDDFAAKRFIRTARHVYGVELEADSSGPSFSS